jgi:catechol 2,3-dioxygenase-like lactoylglutathione lyase family enzyme
MRTAIAALSIALCASATAETPPAPAMPPARFHHVHLNSVDPAAAIEFYAAHFKGRKERFAGLTDALWTGDSWLLFTKVAAPPPSELLSGVWHIGWGAEDMPATYGKQLAAGTRFATPVTDISDLVGGGRSFFYAYVDGPDHALIELNTARHHSFGHVHLFSADPVAAGDWYAKHLGLRVFQQKELRVYKNVPVGPAAFVTAPQGNQDVSMIVYPLEHLKATQPELWKDRTALVSTRGRVIDHLGFSVEDLDATLARLRAEGVEVTSEPRRVADGRLEFAFITGPDQIAIELIEDHSPRPAAVE